MNKEAKEKLKEKLPWGWSTIISNRTGYSKNWICDVMKGKRSNDRIELEAIKLAEECDETRRKLKDHEVQLNKEENETTCRTNKQ